MHTITISQAEPELVKEAPIEDVAISPEPRLVLPVTAPAPPPILSEAKSLGRPATVLVVDDEPQIAKAFERILRSHGIEVVVAVSGTCAREVIRANRFDFILCDLFMPDFDGLDILRAAAESDPACPVAVITGGASLEAAEEALQNGAWRYLQKPVSADELIAVVRVGIQLKKQRAQFAREPSCAQTTKLVNGQISRWLDNALSSLWMAYQPIVRRQGEIFGYEALVRTNEPRLSRPDLLFSAAARLGRIDELDAKIHRRVAADIPKADPDLHFFVNLDPSRAFLNESFLAGEDPLSPFANRIILEVTENAPLGVIRDLDTKLAAIRRQGYRLAVDDLGSGYSALSAFSLLEPDVVKLDMSLIRDIDKSATKQKLVECMAETCEQLGVAVVCEGVETREEYDVLLKTHADLMQGYYFGKPGKLLPGGIG